MQTTCTHTRTTHELLAKASLDIYVRSECWCIPTYYDSVVVHIPDCLVLRRHHVPFNQSSLLSLSCTKNLNVIHTSPTRRKRKYLGTDNSTEPFRPEVIRFVLLSLRASCVTLCYRTSTLSMSRRAFKKESTWKTSVYPTLHTLSRLLSASSLHFTSFRFFPALHFRFPYLLSLSFYINVCVRLRPLAFHLSVIPLVLLARFLSVAHCLYLLSST